MSLAPGTRVGPYEIIAPLGAGGMGEVYRARDTRLGRTVAIKVLIDALAADPQFRERFDREARALSQLAHPNICTVYDVGEHAGSAFLVMEILEGETLADRLRRSAGGQLPCGDALAVAVQIADALTAAHRAEIVHRDLKPANVMLTRSGAKLLDFGLAKTQTSPVIPAGVSRMETTPPQPVTIQGTILGTIQYMAPEQVEGGDADARTDIFAFGVVLYEMLTGQKAFDGRSHASLIAAILEREPPPVSTRQPQAPPLLDAIIRKCLAKNPDDRWQSAADLATALKWASDKLMIGGRADHESALGAAPSTRRGIWIAASMGALALMAAIGVTAWRYDPAQVAGGEVRFEVFAPQDAMLTPAPVASAAQLALSPDGRRIAFVAAPRHGASRIWIRELDAVQARSLEDTEGAAFPFWSPDGQFLGFFAGGKLKRIDIAGGVSQSIANASNGRGGAWGANDIIVFALGSFGPLSRVSAEGGTVSPATTLASDAVAHYWPQFLPDGSRFLYYQRSFNGKVDGVWLGSVENEKVQQVLHATSRAIYSRGHLLFVRDGMLFAQAFNLGNLQTSGEPVRIGSNVGYFQSSFGYAAVTESPAGVLAYGPTVAPTTSLRWFDRKGVPVGPAAATGIYTGPRLSPDQKTVVMSVREHGSWTGDVWVLDLARSTASRTTFDAANEWFPAWSANGSRLFFGSTRAGSTAMFEKAGVESEQLLSDGLQIARYPADASSDGRFLLYVESNRAGYDLGVVPLTTDRKFTTFIVSAFNEVQGRFSPNGRWVAYASDESGRFEVYVRPFPPANGQWKMSVAGGMQPEWRRDGRELYYISTDGKLMAVPVRADGATPEPGTPIALFDVDVPEASQPYPNHYVVSADGQRFLVNSLIDQPTRPALTVVLNWAAALAK